jgi:hypothetical protein
MVTFSMICSVRSYDDDSDKYIETTEDIKDACEINNKIIEVINHFNKVRIMNKFQVRTLIGNDLMSDVHHKLSQLRNRLELAESSIIISKTTIKKNYLSFLLFLESATI